MRCAPPPAVTEHWYARAMQLWCSVCSVTAPMSLSVVCRPRSFSPVPEPGLPAMTHTECAILSPPDPSPGYPTGTPLRSTNAVPAPTGASFPPSPPPAGPHEILTGSPGAPDDHRPSPPTPPTAPLRPGLRPAAQGTRGVCGLRPVSARAGLPRRRAALSGRVGTGHRVRSLISAAAHRPG